jgi:hypothetical protein
MSLRLSLILLTAWLAPEFPINQNFRRYMGKTAIFRTLLENQLILTVGYPGPFFLSPISGRRLRWGGKLIRLPSNTTKYEILMANPPLSACSSDLHNGLLAVISPRSNIQGAVQKVKILIISFSHHYLRSEMVWDLWIEINYYIKICNWYARVTYEVPRNEGERRPYIRDKRGNKSKMKSLHFLFW